MFVLKVNEEIYLKLVDLSDAAQIFNLTEDSREHLRNWLPWLDITKSVEDTKTFIQASLNDYVKHKSMNTVILYKGEMVGIAGFNELDWSNKIAHIGYWLGEGYQGPGIMIKVVEALIDYAMNVMKFNRAEIRVARENVKSKAIPEKLGFENEGCMKEAEWLYGAPVDHVVYGMLARDWNKK